MKAGGSIVINQERERKRGQIEWRRVGFVLFNIFSVVVVVGLAKQGFHFRQKIHTFLYTRTQIHVEIDLPLCKAEIKTLSSSKP